MVIDVLRATTTIATALANGAREIVTCVSIEEARERALGCDALLGGERKGVRIEGFDLGNSPRDYTPERIGGRTIVFTTTNGTVALRHAEQAKRVLVGALVNRATVARELGCVAGDIHLLCAGTGGQPSFDDCVTAGAIADAVLQLAPAATLDDHAMLYRSAWRGIGDVIAAFRTCRGGRNLIDVGLGDDIAACVQVDSVASLCEMQGGVVRAAAPRPTTIPA